MAVEAAGGEEEVKERCDTRGHVVTCTFLKWSRSSNCW